MIGKVTQPLAKRKHPQALALTRPVQEGVALRAESLAHRRRDRREFAGELVEGVAETVTEAHSWKQCAHVLGRTIEAIGQDSPDTIGRLLLERRVLELLVGLGKGRGTGLRSVAQMPEHAPTDNGRQVYLSAGHLLCFSSARK